MSTTLELTSAEIAGLRLRLEQDGFKIGGLQHGKFQAREEGVVVNAYKSGKVVVQGKGEAAFLERYGLSAPVPVLAEPTVGSDESGKGDYFGPLTVCAVAVRPEQIAELVAAGVRDSKAMGDGVVKRAAVVVRSLCPHAIRVLSPEQYNQRHEQEKNVALFLATLHAEVIAEVVRACDDLRHVVIDQFTFAERLEDALGAEGVNLPVEIRPKAESNPAVAAASVLARSEFLIALESLGGEHGWELPKGAGTPVERVAREMFEAGGMKLLHSVAKTHFKTTQKITGLF